MRGKRLTHGGDWAGYLEQYGQMPLDFSANISPLGVPNGVRQALIQGIADLERYPDPLCRELRRGPAEREKLPMEQILCGNGAADLIYRAVRALAPKTGLVTAPAFAEYEEALKSVGCRVRRYPLKAEREFRLDEGILEALTPEVEVFFLCEPNNPTGVTTEDGLLDRILARCQETGTRLILDECFGELLDQPQAHTRKNRLAEHPNILILKSMTKLYALAGLRLGYALCADGALLNEMHRMGQPWEVSQLAQRAGLAALEERDYVEAVRTLVRRERPLLGEGLAGLGCRVIPGEANYLLFQSPWPLEEPLRERGILLRSCGNYEGLDRSWYRTAVRTHEENQKLLAALREVLR